MEIFSERHIHDGHDWIVIQDFLQQGADRALLLGARAGPSFRGSCWLQYSSGVRLTAASRNGMVAVGGVQLNYPDSEGRQLFISDVSHSVVAPHPSPY